MPAGDGFQASTTGIRDYSGSLADDKALAAEISGLVDQSDVGNESWGIVGLFVKSTYSDMLGDLKDLLGDMQDGLQSGADKMSECAQEYQDIEDAIAKIFNDGRDELGGN